MLRLLSFAGFALGLFTGFPASTQQPLSTEEAEMLFIHRVAPLLKGQCLKCHGDEPELQGKLDLRTRASMLQGGESGEALVPGKPYQSLIYRAVRYDDEIRMPPKAKFNQRLADAELNWVFQWIEAGAPWPESLKMAEVMPSAKIFVGVDPTNPGLRLPNYSMPIPDYQFKLDDVVIPAARETEPKLAEWSAKKAAEYLDVGALAWTRQRQCVTCHTNGAYMMSRPALTPYLGPPLAEVKTLFTPRRREPNLPLEKRPAVANPIFDLQIACALAEWDAHVTRELSAETDQAMRLMCDAQQPTGHWKTTNERWIPYILNPFHDACMFAKAVGTVPGWLEKLRSDNDQKSLAAVDRLRKYLQTAEPTNDYDRVHLLWAELRWPGLIDSAKRTELLKLISRKQRADGGWATRSFGSPTSWGNGNRAKKLKEEAYGDDPPSDAHMTGLAIIVLREAGTPLDDARIQHGVTWLKTNQRISGRWWTRSLNTDYWQFATYFSTSNALLALGMCGEIPRQELPGSEQPASSQAR